MKTTRTLQLARMSALLITLLVGACGSESPESMLASAKEYFARNDSKAAVIQLKNALQNKPDLAEARFLLGKALLDEGNPVAADVELRKAAELKYAPDQLVPLQARTLLLMGQAKKVIDELGKVELSSADAKADLQTSVGRAHLTTGKVDSAQAAFAAAVAAVPGYGPALIGQARIKAASRDLPGALALLDSALEKSPKLHEALQFKGDILGAQGKAKEAMDTYLKVLQDRPDYLPAHVAVIARHLDGNNLEEAGKQMEALKKVAPAHPQTKFLQAEMLFREKKFKEAQDVVQQYLRVLPDSGPGLQLAGAIEFELKSYATAEKHLLAALPRTPELGMARRLLILTYLRSGQPDKALGVLQPILDKIDKNSSLLALAGEVYMQNGDAAKAGAYFTKSSALDPENKAKQTSVAISHMAQGDTETAFRELEKIAASDSGSRADMALIASQLRARKFTRRSSRSPAWKGSSRTTPWWITCAAWRCSARTTWRQRARASSRRWPRTRPISRRLPAWLAWTWPRRSLRTRASASRAWSPRTRRIRRPGWPCRK